MLEIIDSTRQESDSLFVVSLLLKERLSVRSILYSRKKHKVKKVKVANFDIFLVILHYSHGIS